MTESQLRSALHQHIDAMDASMLKVISAMIEAYHNNIEVLGHSIDGHPLTRDALHKRVKEAETQIERGEFLDQKKLESTLKKR